MALPTWSGKMQLIVGVVFLVVALALIIVFIATQVNPSLMENAANIDLPFELIP